MKIVVLDDEEKVCTLICTLIDWKGIGLTLEGTASDGPSGLALLEKKKPDLLITDIRMPGMDGLELIEKAKKNLPDLQVIIISGYSQFDYAQKAIRCGVVNYLLKPVKKQELNDTLKKMAAQYERMRLATSKTQELEEQVRSHELQNRKNTLRTAVQQHDAQVFASCGLAYPVRLFAVKIDGMQPPYDMQAEQVLADKLEEFADADGKGISALSGSVCFIVRPGTDDEYGVRILAWAKAQVQIFRSFTLTVSTCPAAESPDAFPVSVGLLYQGLSRRLDEGTLAVYEENAYAAPENFNEQPLVKELFTSMQQSNRQLFFETLGKFLTPFSRKKYPPYECECAVRQCCTSILDEAKQRLEPSSYASAEKEYALVDMACSRESLADNAAAFADKVYTRVTEDERDRLVRPIRDAQLFIARHFDDSGISLAEVAAHVGLNATYFSGLFKKSCNTGFAEYLQSIRLEKAKDLLVTTSKPVKQIAADTGYSDPKHFAKVFRSVIGINPNEYRQLYI